MITGHSLGCGLASAAAIMHNSPAVTFNASGVHPDTVAEYGATLAGADGLIDAYRVQGEVLSTLQDTALSWGLSRGRFGIGGLAYLMPDSTGTTHWLPGTSWSRIKRHLMPAVLAGMEAMGAR